jgi:MraZ protein
MIFTGRTPLTIDPKGRLQIPAKVIAVLAEMNAVGTPWYSIPWPNGRVRLYTAGGFAQLQAQRSRTATPSTSRQAFEAAFFGMAERLEMDGSNRVVVPKDHLRLAGLGTGVTLVGAGDRLELWDRAKWEQEEQALFLSMGNYTEGTDPPGA